MQPSPSTDATLSRPPALARAELLIAYVLRYGVLLCAAIMLLGMVLMLLQPGSGSLLEQARSADAGALALAPRTLAAFREGLARCEPNTVIALGMVLLIALPIVRVGLTVVLFILQRDYVYFGITVFVFSVLVLGIVLGKAL